MRTPLPYLIMTGCLAVVMGAFAWLASRIRRRGLAGSAMNAAPASYEEAFRITAHESHVEVQEQARRKAPLLSPDDHWERHPGMAGQARGAKPGTVRRRPRWGVRRWADRKRDPSEPAARLASVEQRHQPVDPHREEGGRDQ